MPLNLLTLTRFPSGVTNKPENDIWGGGMPFPDAFRAFHAYVEDFDYFLAADWTVTETQAGATQALLAGNNGLLALVNSAADDDVNQIQKIAASFLPIVGKRLFLAARFMLDDVTQSDFAIGLINASADATVLANSVDGIFFLKADDAATVTLYSRQDNTTGSVNSGAIATLVNATMVELACYYDGGDRIYYAVNGTVGGYITVSSALLPNANVTPTFALKNGSAAARTATVDYMFAFQER